MKAVKIYNNIFLPFPPASGNHRLMIQSRGGKPRFFQNQAYRKYREDILLSTPRGSSFEPLPDDRKWMKDILLLISIQAPDRRIRDCDGILKVVLDVLKELWEVDDSRFLPRCQEYAVNTENPHVFIYGEQTLFEGRPVSPNKGN